MRKGFTLLEVLIVVAVLAILLTMMIPSHRSAEVSARAGMVITNMSNLAAAFQMAYAENPDKFKNAPNNYTNGKLLSIASADVYIDNLHTEDYGKYAFVFFNKPGDRRYGWWVRYTLEGDSSELRLELADRIVSNPALGIYSYNSEGNIGGANLENIGSGKMNRYLIMKAR